MVQPQAEPDPQGEDLDAPFQAYVGVHIKQTEALSFRQPGALRKSGQGIIVVVFKAAQFWQDIEESTEGSQEGLHLG